jgi:hypothetical protein
MTTRDITSLLHACRDGGAAALEQLVPPTIA